MTCASGQSEVKLRPEGLSEAGADTGLGRISLEQQFHGQLGGGSKSDMLNAAG
ncbi:hypothetical protein AAKU55_003020 [Oxalobacteraceae bacterium GrIS 1.11]